jgi:hypothetical protein
MFSGAGFSAPFDNTVALARTAGMGGALYFSDGDSSLLLQNPAALSELRHPQMSLHHNSWIADVIQEIVVLGLPLGQAKNRAALGITANYVNYGHFQGRDETGRITTALGASDLGLSLGFGGHLIGPISGGLSLKSMQQTLADQSYTSFSVDVGLLAQPGKEIWLSAAYGNLGSSIGGSERAGMLRLGLAAGTALGSEAAFRFGLGANLRPQGESQFNVGAEIGLSEVFQMRAGYSLPLQNVEISGLNNLALGAGFKVLQLTLDYAYLPFGELGAVHRVSIHYAFAQNQELMAPPPGAPQPKPVAQPQAAPPALPPAPAAQPSAVATPLAAGADGVEFVMEVPDRHLAEARRLAGQGEALKAIAAYSLAIEDAPEDAKAWRELGDLYFKSGKHDFALRCYEEVVKLRPENIELKAWIGQQRHKIE